MLLWWLNKPKGDIIEPKAWGVVYDSSYLKLRVSPEKTHFLFEIKQQSGMSDHEKMIKTILDSLLAHDITTLNVDHIRWAGKQKSISLAIDKIRVDFAIFYKEQMIHLEIKSEREALLDSAYHQVEIARRKKRIVGLVIPASSYESVNNALKYRRLWNKVFPIVYENLVDDPVRELKQLIRLAD